MRAHTHGPRRGALRGLDGLEAPPGSSVRASVQDREPGARETRAAPARRLTPRLLRAVYQDLLGRPPRSAEREEWLGLSLHALLGELVGSESFWTQWFDEQIYYFLLIDNFRPLSERVQSIPGELLRGGMNVQEALHAIALSPSFDRRNPGPDTFVSVVMEQLDGITVQRERRELEIGKVVYDGGTGLFLGRTASSQADLVRIAVEHELFFRTLAEREYLRIVRDAPSRVELRDWTRRLRKDPFSYADLVREWVLSPAYADRVERRVPQPNRLFIRTLFVDLLDRLPDEDEAIRMRGALDGLSDPGPLRSILARLLLDSNVAPVPSRAEIQDPTAWVRGLFLRLLGRPATETELKAFVGSFHRPDCRPSTVIYAILSHPEYHRY